MEQQHNRASSTTGNIILSTGWEKQTRLVAAGTAVDGGAAHAENAIERCTFSLLPPSLAAHLSAHGKLGDPFFAVPHELNAYGTAVLDQDLPEETNAGRVVLVCSFAC